MESGITPGLDLHDMTNVFNEANRKARRDLGKINVLVAGLAGVGKSTLINAVFGRKVAMTGVGFSQTQRTEAHEVPDSPLRIYDTRGFEIINAEKTVGAVQACIETLRASTDPNDQIHIAWTCILEQSHRIEPVHKNLLTMLQALRVPSIVVITQALGEAEMESKVRELAVPNDEVAAVLAEPKIIASHTFPQRGVGELVETCIRLLPQSQRAAFIAAQKARWDLKEAEVIKSINWYAASAAASSLIPIPGGHSVALVGMQVALVAKINITLGLSLSDTGGKDFVKGLFGIMLTKAGGQAAFTMTLTEAMKFFPGLGWFGAAMIGGPIAGAATKAFGHLYFNAVAGYAQREEPLPPPEILARQMEQMIESQKGRYESLSRETS
jgi:uncharacterized protein (DUF697 family)/GTP-binding protein EngB required for normal cell division